MRTTTRSGLLIVGLMLGSLLVWPPPVGADVVCCDAVEYDLYLVGEGSSASLTPFHADLIDEQSAQVETAIEGAFVVAEWTVTLTSSGDYSAADWQFNIPYMVENAAGVTLNATVVVEVGGEEYTGSTGSIPTLLMPAADAQWMSIDIPVDSGVLASSDTISARLEVRKVSFDTPTGDSRIEFIWGDQDDDASLRVTLPLLDLDMLDPIVEGRSVHFPVVVLSGFGGSMYSQAHDITFTVGNSQITDAPVREVIGEGVRLTWTWEAPGTSTSEQVSVTLSLDVQEGTGGLFTGMRAYDLTFDSSDGGGGGYYPELEPDRTGESMLAVEIEAKLSGDELTRTTTLRFTGSAAMWVRWGMDNIQGDELSSQSYWRTVASTGIPTGKLHNRVVDSEERARFSEHLRTGSSSLPNFLTQGLDIEPTRLLGGSRADFNVFEVDLTLAGSEVDTSEVTIKVKALEVIPDETTVVFVREFLRDEPIRIWTDVSLDVVMTATLLTGLNNVIMEASESLDMSQWRLFIVHRLAIQSDSIDADDEFSVTFVAGGTVISSALGGVVVGMAAVLAGLVVAVMAGRGRKRGLLMLAGVAVVVAVACSYVLAFSTVTYLMLVGGGAVLLVLVGRMSKRKDVHLDLGPRPMATPMAAASAAARPRRERPVTRSPAAQAAPASKPKFDEPEPIAQPSGGAGAAALKGGQFRRRERHGMDRRRRGTSVPVVTCPKCSTANPVSTAERPVIIGCRSCGQSLKVVD